MGRHLAILSLIESIASEFVAGAGDVGVWAGQPEVVCADVYQQKIARAVCADEAKVLGGTIYRKNGKLVFTENSGHYGHKWTNETRDQFQKFLKGNGVEYEYNPGR